jgi:hypothetical protein
MTTPLLGLFLQEIHAIRTGTETLHVLSMSLTAENHIKDSCNNLQTHIEATFLSHVLAQIY